MVQSASTFPLFQRFIAFNHIDKKFFTYKNNVIYYQHMSKKININGIPDKLFKKLIESENSKSCLMASQSNSRTDLRRCLESGKLVEPYYGFYAIRDHWDQLLYKDKVKRIAVTLTNKIKIKKWNFTGETAAVLLGLEVVHLPYIHHSLTEIYVSSSYAEKFASNKKKSDLERKKSVRSAFRHKYSRLKLPNIIEDESGIRLDDFTKNRHKNVSNGTIIGKGTSANSGTVKNTNLLTASSFGHIATDEELAISHVASIYNVLYVCAWKGSFAESLATFDSAARKGEDLNKILRVCRKFYGSMDCCSDTPQFLNSVQNPKNADFYGVNYSPINNPNFLGTDEFDVLSRMETLVNYANPKSENGGESLARAIMLELGFVEPELQHEFPNPNHPQSPYRADFMWKVNGKIIVGEFDGTDKYLIEDRTLPDNRSVACDLRTEDFDGSVENINNFSTNNLYRYNRDAVRKERNRERWLMDCGVVRVVRFDYCDILNPIEFKKKLLSAGVPVAVA